MFIKYVFTSSISSSVENDKSNASTVYLSLQKLDDYLNGKGNPFENNVFNIEMARFFTNISNVENVIFELLEIDPKIEYSGFFNNLMNFITLIPEKIEVEIIEPDFNESSLSSKIECSIFSNVSKMASLNKSLTRLIKNNYQIKPVPTTIFGSCCSRDIFSAFHKYNKTSNFKINMLTMNVSFSTLFGDPLKYDEENLNVENYNTKNAIVGDLTKSIPNAVIQSLNSDSIVILDFMDERFDIVECERCKFTKSWSIMNTKLYKNFKNTSTISFDDERKILDSINNAKRLISLLINYIPMKNIIINESKMAECFFKDDGFEYFDNDKYNISKYNDMHNAIVAELKKDFSGITFLDSPIYLNFGDTHHQWGTHPYHYNEGHYLCKVKKILLNSIG